MPPLRKTRLPPLSPSAQFTQQFARKNSGGSIVGGKPTASRSVSPPLSPRPAMVSDDDTPSRREAKVIAATAVFVLLLVAMAGNFYIAMAVESQSSSEALNSPPWDRTAALMFASFGELACSMTLITVLATLNLAFLWGCLAGLMGLVGFVVVAIVSGVGGPATATLLGFSIFWTAFIVELNLKLCPVLVQWMTKTLSRSKNNSSSASSQPELPLAHQHNNNTNTMNIQNNYTNSSRRSSSASSFDDTETLYSPPSSDDGYVVNINEK